MNVAVCSDLVAKSAKRFRSVMGDLCIFQVILEIYIKLNRQICASRWSVYSSFHSAQLHGCGVLLSHGCSIGD